MPKLPVHFEKWNRLPGGSGRQTAKLAGLNERLSDFTCQTHSLPA